MKDDRVLLGHIRDAISDIREYASVGQKVFVAERMRQDAIIAFRDALARREARVECVGLPHGSLAPPASNVWSRSGGRRIQSS